MLKCLILLSFFIQTPSLWSQTHKISEKFLLEQSNQGSPSLDEIEAQFLISKTKSLEAREEFTPEIFAKGSRAETNERALITFQPIFTPTTQTQLGMRQNIKYGLATSVSLFSDERNSSSSPVAGNFRHATTMGVNLTMQLDVWKNLLGRMSQARLEVAGLEVERASYQKEIQTKTFKISLRKLYWSIVANEESLKISEELLKTAQRQAQEAKQRFKNAVADADEVARYEAQVTSRQSSILYLKYRREIFVTQLRNLLPKSLGTGEVLLDSYNLNESISEVLACTSYISQEKQIPYQNTMYDEIVELLRKTKKETQDLNARYADVDVKLFGTVKATGVSSEIERPGRFRGSYGGAIDDISNTNRTGYEVGIMMSLPLGDSKDQTQRTKELYDEKRLLASMIKTENQVINTHQELVKTIGYLNEVIRNQKATSEQLAKRLAGMRRKYAQARVSVNDLIMDQDALLNSELSIIDTQLQVLNIIFDYLIVFTETPCSFNRI